MPARRDLDFRSFDEISADVAALAAAPYTRCGNWDLATICDHLARTIEAGLDNQAVRFPIWLRVVAPVLGPVIFRRILKKRRFPMGVNAPANLAPNESCDCADAVARLNTAMTGAAGFRGPLSPHPIFGRATVEQWQEAMMIHCAHHLSFLLPGEATYNATRAN